MGWTVLVGLVPFAALKRSCVADGESANFWLKTFFCADMGAEAAHRSRTNEAWRTISLHTNRMAVRKSSNLQTRVTDWPLYFDGVFSVFVIFFRFGSGSR